MERKPLIFVAIPALETAPIGFVESLVNLQCPKGYQMSVTFVTGSLVYDARNKLIAQALEQGADYILWLDSDMLFDYDIIDKLLKDDVDFVSGVYYRRKPPFSPVLYKQLRVDLEKQAHWEDYLEVPDDQLFEIEGCGFGCVLMTAKLAKAVTDKYNLGFSPMPSAGEDLSFCLRARAMGYTLYADSRIQLGHVSTTMVSKELYDRLGGPEFVKQSKAVVKN